MDARLYTALCFGVHSWALSGVVEGNAFELELRRPRPGWATIGEQSQLWWQHPPYQLDDWEQIYLQPFFVSQHYYDYTATQNHASIGFCPHVISSTLNDSVTPLPWTALSDISALAPVNHYATYAGAVAITGPRPPEVGGNEYHMHPCTITAFGVQATIYLRVANARQEQVTLNLRALYYEDFGGIIDPNTGKMV